MMLKPEQRGLVSTASCDLLVVGSDNVGLLRNMNDFDTLTRWYPIDAVETIERVIELDPSIADTYRIQAELYLTTFPSTTDRLRGMRPQVLEERYERAVAAWQQFEALTTPKPEVEADHHFARGAVLAELERKEEAQTAYQKAFELGYDEGQVREALVKLNQ